MRKNLTCFYSDHLNYKRMGWEGNVDLCLFQSNFFVKFQSILVVSRCIYNPNEEELKKSNGGHMMLLTGAEVDTWS